MATDDLVWMQGAGEPGVMALTYFSWNITAPAFHLSPHGQDGLQFWFQFHWNFFLKGPIDNKSALVQVMASRRTGDKPLPEAMMTQFTNAYIRH